MNKKISGIYAITPDNKLDISIIEQIIIKHKISILQYRRKTANKKTKQNEAVKLAKLCFEYNTLFIINDDINLAQKVSADGVHLGKDDGSILKARKKLGVDAIIGVSCYDDIDKARQAQERGADYVAFGALFPSSTKPNATRCALDVVTKAKKSLTIPIVGIGGIDFSNKNKALDKGCDSVAMINTLFTKNHAKFEK